MEDDKKLLEFLVSTLIQNVMELGLEIRAYRRVIEASDSTLLANVTQAISDLRASDARDSHDEMRRQALRAVTDRNLAELSTVVGHLLSAARIENGSI